MTKLFIKKRYGQVPNDILNNPDLTFKAKWLWWYIQSKPDGWDFSADRIKHDTKDWRDWIKAWLRELEDQWLLIRDRVHKQDWTWEHMYYLLENPVEIEDLPSTDIPSVDNPSINKEYNKKERNNIIEDSSSSKTNNVVNDEIDSFNTDIAKQNKSTRLRSKTVSGEGKLPAKKVRNHLDIVADYEENWIYNIDELASKAVQNEYEMPGLKKLAVVFLDYYSGNKDKLDWKVNIKARFNKFVQTDYHNLLTKKSVWPWIHSVTDEQFLTLMEQWHFRNSTCEFFKKHVRPTLDTQWLNTFNEMISFFRNKDVEWYKWYTFHEWMVKEGKIIA